MFKYNLVYFFLEKAVGCVFQNTVFQPDSDFVPIIAMANEIEDCIVYLVTDSVFNISSLWVTPSKKTVKIFGDSNMTKLYFEFKYKIIHNTIIHTSLFTAQKLQ